MKKRLLVVNGHPDPRPERFCGALSDAYARGAKSGGWETRRLNVGQLPLCAVQANGGDTLYPDVVGAIGDIAWANRLAVVYPLWMDQPPDVLLALFNRVLSVLAVQGESRRRAHVIVTMELPALVYRSMLGPDAPVKARALSIPGVIPVEPVLIGCVGSMSRAQRRRWLETISAYGERSYHGLAHASRTHAIAEMIDRTVTHWWNGGARRSA